MENSKQIYVCGKMTGVDEYNYPKFNETAKMLRGRGYRVKNPAEIVGEDHWGWVEYMRKALHKLIDCDTIYVLCGHETSKGAKTEIQLALQLGMKIIYEVDTVNTDVKSNPNTMFQTKPIITCNMGGDTSNKCLDCVYNVDYKNDNGICVERTD